MPAVTMTPVTPRAISPIMDICRTILIRLIFVRKAGDKNEAIMNIPRKIKNIPYFRKRFLMNAPDERAALCLRFLWSFPPLLLHAVAKPMPVAKCRIFSWVASTRLSSPILPLHA